MLTLAGPVEWEVWLEHGREYAASPWMILLLIGLQVAMYSVALPASSLIVVVAALYAPWTSTLILTVGTSIGALAAYFVASHLGNEWRRRLEHRPLFRLLQHEGSFSNLFALRVLPGFPNAIINYSAGLLRLPLTPFLTSAMLGVFCKTALYSHAIWYAISAGEAVDLLRPGVILPLLLLVLLAALARWYQGRLRID